MSKGLEALNRIKMLEISCDRESYDLRPITKTHKEDLNTIEKELKALEIIKKHFVFHHIGMDIGNKTFHVIATSEKLIPTEDYYLLKEVLKDE